MKSTVLLGDSITQWNSIDGIHLSSEGYSVLNNEILKLP